MKSTWLVEEKPMTYLAVPRDEATVKGREVLMATVNEVPLPVITKLEE